MASQPASPIRPSTEPIAAEIGLDEGARQKLAQGLGLVLADSYVLLGRTHGFHWNVTGPQFPGLHTLFEDEYKDLQQAVDKIAERIRALGFFAPGSLESFVQLSRLAADGRSNDEVPDAQAMCRLLAQDHEQVARGCREVVELCEEAEDTVTEDLLNDRIAAHEKAAWMLRASLAA